MFIITFGEMLTMIFIEFYKKSLPILASLIITKRVLLQPFPYRG